MIIYNVTSTINASIHDTWLAWIKEHIPQVLATGCFTKATLTRIMIADPDGFVTYSVQYRAESREDLERYYQQHADALQEHAVKRFGDKVLSFRTELNVIDEFSVTFN